MKTRRASMRQESVSGVLEDLRRQLAELETERARLDQEINELLNAVSALSILIKNENNAAASDKDASKTPWRPSASFDSEGESTSSAVRKLARGMMKDLNRPVTRAELARATRDAGISLGGVNPEKTISKILTRGKTPQFYSVGQGKGYWPTNLPLPPGV